MRDGQKGYRDADVKRVVGGPLYIQQNEDAWVRFRGIVTEISFAYSSGIMRSGAPAGRLSFSAALKVGDDAILGIACGSSNLDMICVGDFLEGEGLAELTPEDSVSNHESARNIPDSIRAMWDGL